MRGVGPAGKWFTAPNVRGRNMVVTIGGRRRVGGRTLKRKDYEVISLAIRRGVGLGQELQRIFESPIDAL